MMWGLSGPAPAQQLSLQEFGQSHGLKNLAVTALAQDGAGLIWAGTQNGAYRFDGARFERVGGDEKLVSVNSFAVDGPRVWIAADAGLWSWREGRLERVQPDGPPLDIGSYPQMVAPDGAGGAWVVSDWHLLRLTPASGGAWHRQEIVVEPDASVPRDRGSITSVIAGEGADAWFGCGRRICRWHGGQVDAWGQARGVPADSWHWLLRGSDGSLWARGVRHVLQLEPGATSFADRSDARDEADPNGTYPLAEDAQHRIVGAARNVLTRWDGHAWHRFGTGAGLPAGGRLQALLRDREGGLWLGMLGAGVLQWRGYGQWENWSVASGLPHTAVWQFARAGSPGNTALYVATGAGVAALDDDADRFHALAGTAGQEVLAMASDARGALWATTAHGRLLRFEAKGGAGERGTPVQPAGAKTVFGVFTQRAGDVWIDTDVGLYHRLAEGSDKALVKGGLAEGEILRAACEDRDGAMWFATDKGVTRFAHDRWEPHPARVAANAVLACLRDGTLAIANGAAGVQILSPEGSTLRVRDVTPALLHDRVVLALREDSRGWLWVSTDAGVAVWDRRHWRLLDDQRGLVWNDTSGNAIFEDLDGTMWIGTSRGASHLLAPAHLFDPVTGRVAIRGFARGDRPLAVDRAIALPWSPDPITIDLALPVFRDRAALAIEYRLRPFDDRWTPSAHPEIRLTGLPAGQYRFEARAVDSELGTPSPPTGFDFEIDPPWWQSRPAIAALLAATLAAGLALYRWRMRVMVLQAQHLETLVRERTRELEESRELLHEQATRDSLTKVWNRRALMEILAREVNRCARERLPFAIALVDIDHFKQVNDTYGHPAGDAVLREFAERLCAGVRPYDSVGRYGGEEFLVALPGLDVAQPEHRARLATIHQSIAASPMEVVGTVTCSFGVAGTSGAGVVDVDALIASADEALYRAKRGGRNRIEWNLCGTLPEDALSLLGS